ncbi:MAG: NfeD family protein [Euryarchaeota archaeon]|jgi:membrane protein implicated in regulation of membrane protease activity|nr:NfeD family protein [Euryarchaeota archaeon]
MLDTILGFFGLEGITGVDVLFAACAIIGTILFLLYFVLVMLTGAADGMLEVAGFDFEMDAAGVFHMFTLQGLLSFVMMFGIFGLAVSQSGDNTNAVLAVLAGTAAGTASMYVVAKVFQAMQSLESDGTVVHNKALGARGTVYRRIDPNKPGQVQVEFQGALRTMSARSDDEAATLETGSLIEVVDTIGEILIVAPLDRKATTRKEEE